MGKVSRLLQNLSVVLLTVVMMFPLIMPSIAEAAYKNRIQIEWVYVKSDLDWGADDWSDPEVWMQIRYNAGTPGAYWSEWKGTGYKLDVPTGNYAFQGVVLDFPCTAAEFIQIYVKVNDADIYPFYEEMLNTNTGILDTGQAHDAITLTGTHADIKFNVTDIWCELASTGGIAELPDLEALPAETSDTAADHTKLAWTIGGATIGVLILATGTAWYARGRWLRHRA